MPFSKQTLLLFRKLIYFDSGYANSKVRHERSCGLMWAEDLLSCFDGFTCIVYVSNVGTELYYIKLTNNQVADTGCVFKHLLYL